MNLEQVPYLVLCVLAICMAGIAPAQHRTHALVAATWLLADNIIYNATWLGGIVTYVWWPVMTAAFFFVMVALSVLRLAAWKVGVLVATWLQGLAHVSFWISGSTSEAAWGIYTVALDCTFLAQLLFVSAEGLRRGWSANSDRFVLDADRGTRARPVDLVARRVSGLGDNMGKGAQ